jgi:hypothetical protein
MAHIGNGKHSARTILEGKIEEGERAPPSSGQYRMIWV